MEHLVLGVTQKFLRYAYKKNTSPKHLHLQGFFSFEVVNLEAYTVVQAFLPALEALLEVLILQCLQQLLQFGL